MSPKAMLSSLEHLVVAAALRLPDAYGAAIVTEIESQTSRIVPAGSLYVTLDRLQRRGLVTTYAGEPVPGRGGRPKRIVEVTAEGRAAMARYREACLRMWSGIEGDLGDAVGAR